jgi:hypothetical protein
VYDLKTKIAVHQGQLEPRPSRYALKPSEYTEKYRKQKHEEGEKNGR